MPDDLLRQLQSLEWPKVAMDRPKPAPGQLWRASAHGAACLVVILDRPREGAAWSTVVLALSERVGDDMAIRARCVNGMEVTVWGGLRKSCPLPVLDHRLSDLTAASWAELLAVANGSMLGHWASIVNILDDRTLIWLQLLEDFETVATAERFSGYLIPRPAPHSYRKASRTVGVARSRRLRRRS